MFFILAILAALLQITVLRDLNLLVVLAVFSGLRKGPLAGLLIGISIGSLAEVFSSSAFGLNLGLYSMVGFVSGLIRSGVYYRETILTEFIFSFFGVLLFYFAYFILTNVVCASLFHIALFSAMLAPIIFRIAGR